MGAPEPEQDQLLPTSQRAQSLDNRPRLARTTWTQRWIALTLTAILALKLYNISPYYSPPARAVTVDPLPLASHNKCTPPSPNVFAFHPPRPSHKLIQKASKNVDEYLRKRASKPDIDSISVGIVTPAGILFEGGYGVLKANETVGEGALAVDRDTIYRIASITKMFTVLETLILRERGVLNWDDPVDKYLPDIQPFSGSWSDLLTGATRNGAAPKPRITLRQLATHMSGIGRDYPPYLLPEWPLKPDTELPDAEFIRNYTAIVDSISSYPLVNSPYHYPVYSNTGMDVLGLANVAANAQARSDYNAGPKTHKELIQRDIFDPLGFTHSFYRIPNNNTLRDRVAVASPSETEPDATDIEFGDAHDPCGAQYSSMGDLAKLMQMILAPRDTTLLPRDTIREWVRPIHNWGLGQSVGAPWEISPFDDVQVFSKGGNLPGYHSEFSLIPEYSYGVIVLVTGSYSDTSSIVTEILKRFHHTFKDIQEQELRKKYAGKWSNGDDFIEVTVRKGIPYIQKAVVRGQDMLTIFGDTDKAAAFPLWTTGHPGEFWIATGRPNLNNQPGAGCMPYWITINVGLLARGAPIDLVYWRGGMLHYPSSGLVLRRGS